jgi:hypothetical protein
MRIWLSTRSGGTNLARPFQPGSPRGQPAWGGRAGNCQGNDPRRVAKAETNLYAIVATRRKPARTLIPALKRRAKIAPTLRVEGT